MTWPGLGRLLYDGLIARDANIIAGCAATGAAFLALGIFLADVALAAADPRVTDRDEPEPPRWSRGSDDGSRPRGGRAVDHGPQSDAAVRGLRKRSADASAPLLRRRASGLALRQTAALVDRLERRFEPTSDEVPIRWFQAGCCGRSTNRKGRGSRSAEIRWAVMSCPAPVRRPAVIVGRLHRLPGGAGLGMASAASPDSPAGASRRR